MDGRRTTFDTTPMASHTVTLLSCEACINEECEDRGVGVCRAWGEAVRVAGEPTAKGRRRRGRGGRGTYITETSRVRVPKELLVWQCGSGSEHSGQGGGGGGGGGRDKAQNGRRQGGGGRGGTIEREILIGKIGRRRKKSSILKVERLHRRNNVAGFSLKITQTEHTPIHCGSGKNTKGSERLTLM